MVSENEGSSSRVGSVTFTQEPGGADIQRTLSVSQEGADISDLYDLINVGRGGPEDKVTIHSFSKEEVDGSDKFNYAKNTLDKDHSTVWATDDGDLIEGDYKGDGEYIIYDLSSIHAIDFVQFTTTNKSDAFGFQIWTSTTGTEVSDFTRLLPISEDLLLTAKNTTSFNQYEVPTSEARYVKLIGFGRFNDDGDRRESIWSAVGEIEFYGSESLSVDESEFTNHTILFPIPTSNFLNLKDTQGIETIIVYDTDGRKMLDKNVSGAANMIDIDVSFLSNGSYFILLKGRQIYQRNLFIISR